MFPQGVVYTTENGCFAKTYGLDPVDEPTIYGGTAHPDAWLENTYVDDNGDVDFWNDSHTRNGRSTFPLANIRHRSPLRVPPVSYLLLLNRNDNIIPAVARLTREQAGAYFMLGETRGTSAGGAAEAGKNLRVPGTNPFFFDNDALQGNRLIELLDTMPDLEVYLMNTGAVGGAEHDDAAIDVKIGHSSAIIAGIASGTIEWIVDPDFGYEIATSVPNFDNIEILQPRRLYERENRLDEYDRIVAELTQARREYLRSFPGLDEGIVKAI